MPAEDQLVLEAAQAPAVPALVLEDLVVAVLVVAVLAVAVLVVEVPVVEVPVDQGRVAAATNKNKTAGETNEDKMILSPFVL